MSGRAAGWRALGLVAAMFVVCGPAQASEAASKIAEKFAGAGEPAAKTPEAERKPAETRPQAAPKTTTKDAQKEAAQKEAKAKAAREAAQAKQRAAAKAAKAKAAQDAQRAAEMRKTEEAEMLERARQEAQERAEHGEHATLAGEARRLIEEAERARARAEAELAGQGADKEPAEPTAPKLPDSEGIERAAGVRDGGGATPPAGPAREITQVEAPSLADEEVALARQRSEETRQLVEKLKRVRQIREARLAAQEARARDEAKDEAKSAARAQLPPAPPVQPAPPVDAPAVLTQTPPAPPPVAIAAPTPPSPPQITAAPTPMPPPVAAVVPLPPVERAAQLPVEPVSGPAPAAGSPGVPPSRVAVLLILEPGTYGIRRNGPKVADPVLCATEGCYVSVGADGPARFVPGRKALGLGNTWGERAGACRQSLGCVFRDVELTSWPGYLQPVDMHILKHDRRREQVITADSGCTLQAGRLTCSRGIVADTYRMWIVPESLAAAAGPELLQRAVTDGLNGPRSAEALAPLR
jgi:hypothetical protein